MSTKHHEQFGEERTEPSCGLGDHQPKDIPLDLAALIFGQAQDFNEIFRVALKQERKERKQEPKEVNE